MVKKAFIGIVLLGCGLSFCGSDITTPARAEERVEDALSGLMAEKNVEEAVVGICKQKYTHPDLTIVSFSGLVLEAKTTAPDHTASGAPTHYRSRPDFFVGDFIEKTAKEGKCLLVVATEKSFADKDYFPRGLGGHIIEMQESWKHVSVLVVNSNEDAFDLYPYKVAASGVDGLGKLTELRGQRWDEEQRKHVYLEDWFNSFGEVKVFFDARPYSVIQAELEEETVFGGLPEIFA